MSNIRPRKNKEGKITSYQIRVFKGYGPDGRELTPYTASFKPDPDKTERQNQKALNKFAVEFEEKCRLGIVADNRQTFAEYAEYVIEQKKRSGIKHKTLLSYNSFLPLINEHIGHLRLGDIRPQHLNSFYECLSKSGVRRKQGKATAKRDIKALLKSKGYSIKEAAKKCGMASNTVSIVCNGGTIYESKADAIAELLEMPKKQLFRIEQDTSPLSDKTIIEYHRFISTVLHQAEREMIILYNPAAKATPPKLKKHTPHYFQMEEISRIFESIEQEPIKWKLLLHLFISSGIRRGELAGLKWDSVDFENNIIYINNNLQYSPQKGIYDESTKTPESERYLNLPHETMELLKEYKAWYEERKQAFGDSWHDSGYLFFQEKAGNEGKPMHPDSINNYLAKFADENGLPHINPHAFRHTQASILYFNGIDSVSISKRLGHSRVSTTSDIYAHIIKEADKRSSDCIADVLYGKKKVDKESKNE